MSFPLADVIGLNQAQGSYRWDVTHSKPWTYYLKTGF